MGKWLFTARLRQGLTQQEVATRCGISQPRISGIELGLSLPTLPQLLRLARGLAVPLQWFLSGETSPGEEVPELAMELQGLGVVDLLVPKAKVPGAFRSPEQVMALAVSGDQPDPRIVEALPAVLAWNAWDPSVLRAYCRRYDPRAAIRIAWLADLALTIHRTGGFPGGCPESRNLEEFIRQCDRTLRRSPPSGEDDLGYPAEGDPLPAVWKRWRIRYDAPLSTFAERAAHLQSLLDRRRSPPDLSSRSSHE